MGMVQLSHADATPKWKMMVFVCMRTVFFAGPALALGSIAGAFSARSQKSRRAVESSLVFIAAYILVEFALVRFCFVEVSPYLYLLAPLTVLTAAGLQNFGSVRFLAVLIGLSSLFFINSRAAGIVQMMSPMPE